MAELIKFKEEFYAIQEDKTIETDLSSFWLRKTKKPVLAVLLVQKPGQIPKLYRGTNMEVSMPTGSLCAERNVIGSALADDLSLRRQDLKVIVVYSVGTLDASRGIPVKDDTPGPGSLMGSRRGSYESDDTYSNPTSTENYTKLGIDSVTGLRSHPSSSSSSLGVGVGVGVGLSSSTHISKGRSRENSIDSIQYVHTRTVRALSTVGEGVCVGVPCSPSEDSLSRCPSTETSLPHHTVVDCSGDNMVQNTQHSSNNSGIGSVKGSSSYTSSNSNSKTAQVTKDATDFISADSGASILLNDISPSDPQLSIKTAQIDTRRLITAGKRSYSVDSVWVMKGTQSSDLEGTHSWGGGGGGSSTEVKEKVITPSNTILRTNSEPHMLEAWNVDADNQSR